jgi:hypothetical protein
MCICGRDRLLRLHDLDVVGHARREPVARLDQRLIGEIEIISRHRYLIGCRPNIQKSRANLVLDLPAQVRQFILALLQRGPGLDDVRLDSPAVKYVDLRRRHERERAMRAAESRPDVAIVGGDVRGRIAFAMGRLDGFLGRADACL